MRNFISYGEYLSRHPDASGSGITPTAHPAAASAPQTEIGSAPILSAAAASAPPYAPAFAPQAQAVCAPLSAEAAPLSAEAAPLSVAASVPSASVPYAPQIDLGGKKRARGTERARTSDGAKRKGGAFAFVVMLLCFAIAVSCAVMMSQGLGLGHLRGTVVRYEGAPHTAYCVQMAAPGTPEEAAQIARDTRTKGGGGYIYMTDGLYLVLASAYDTEAACDDVIDKLTFSKVSASKFLIEIPAVSLDFTADKATVAVLKECYEAFWKTYLALYEVSVELDEGDLSADAARMKLGEKNAELAELISRLTAAGASCTDMSYIHVKAALTALSGQIDTLYVDMDHAAQLSADLKYAYLKLLHDFRALALELE